MRSSDADLATRVRNSVAECLERHRILRSRRPIVVAVSGGADSLCLLDALVAVVPRPQRRLVVGHVDHHLRPDSAADGVHVRSIAESYGVPRSIESVDVPALAAAERLGVEEAARLGRYRALRRLASTLDTDLLVTGHTRDDSVETVLLHLIRGAGAHGLGGIAEVQHLSAWSLGEAVRGRAADLRLIRPLLHLSRADTVGYCEARGIHFLTDPTNSDPRLLRNRVRAHLLPVLRTYNPAIDRSLSRLAATARDEDAWLDATARRTWHRLGRRGSGPDVSPRITLRQWRRQPVALRRRIVRLFAGDSGLREIGFEAVERALSVGADGGPPRVELGAGLAVERRADYLVFVSHGRRTQ